MDDAAYQDSQSNGPEDDTWKTKAPAATRQPHGYFEPSKWSLLSSYEARRQQHWHRLMADNVATHRVWWQRLMRFLKGQ